MPTAARLIAAIALAITAYGVSHVVLFRHETLQQQGIDHLLFVIVGFCVGWRTLGPYAERGYRGGWLGGLMSTVAVYIACVVVAACFHVINGMSYHAYNNVDDLLTGFFRKAMEFALFAADTSVFVAAIFGGLLAGTFAAMAGRLWR